LNTAVGPEAFHSHQELRAERLGVRHTADYVKDDLSISLGRGRGHGNEETAANTHSTRQRTHQPILVRVVYSQGAHSAQDGHQGLDGIAVDDRAKQPVILGREAALVNNSGIPAVAYTSRRCRAGQFRPPPATAEPSGGRAALRIATLTATLERQLDSAHSGLLRAAFRADESVGTEALFDRAKLQRPSTILRWRRLQLAGHDVLLLTLQGPFRRGQSRTHPYVDCLVCDAGAPDTVNGADFVLAIDIDNDIDTAIGSAMERFQLYHRLSIVPLNWVYDVCLRDVCQPTFACGTFASRNLPADVCQPTFASGTFASRKNSQSASLLPLCGFRHCLNQSRRASRPPASFNTCRCFSSSRAFSDCASSLSAFSNARTSGRLRLSVGGSRASSSASVSSFKAMAKARHHLARQVHVGIGTAAWREVVLGAVGGVDGVRLAAAQAALVDAAAVVRLLLPALPVVDVAGDPVIIGAEPGRLVPAELAPVPGPVVCDGHIAALDSGTPQMRLYGPRFVCDISSPERTLKRLWSDVTLGSVLVLLLFSNHESQTYMFNPKLSKQDIVNLARHILISINFIPLWQFHGNNALRRHVDSFTPEGQLGRHAAVKQPAAVGCFGVVGASWRMVRHLFADCAEPEIASAGEFAVSPCSGLNGLLNRSQFDEAPETTRAAMYWRRNQWMNSEYSKYSVTRCRNDSGSLKLIGMAILVSSLPMQFFMNSQKLKPEQSATRNCCASQFKRTADVAAERERERERFCRMSTATTSRSTTGLWWRCWLQTCVSRPPTADEQTVQADCLEASTAAATAGSSSATSLTHEQPWEMAATVLHQRRRHPAGVVQSFNSDRGQNSSTAEAEPAAVQSQPRRRRRLRLLGAIRSRLRPKPRFQSSSESESAEKSRQMETLETRQASQPKRSAPTQSVCVARYSYSAVEPDELSLAPGDCVLVSERSPDGWWRGSRLSRRATASEDGGGGGDGNCHCENGSNVGVAAGWFPSTHVAPNSIEAEAAAAKPVISNLAPSAKESPPLYRVRALHQFVGSHAEELSFVQNELLDIVDEPADDPDWLMAVAVFGDRRLGLVPRNYVEVEAEDSEQRSAVAEDWAVLESGNSVEDEESSLRHLPFYWGAITRADADDLLMRQARPGQFLVRAGEFNPLDLTLMVRSQPKSRNFKIRRLRLQSAATLEGATETSAAALQKQQQNFCYSIGQKKFDNLRDLVQHYSVQPIYMSAVEQCVLGEAFAQRDASSCGIRRDQSELE
uniref:SH3 domain-containing protein n=1 Tax=Macrostomum lignano TaxID=282301 RepID=A0A1I8I5U9_9PLAT